MEHWQAPAAARTAPSCRSTWSTYPPPRANRSNSIESMRTSLISRARTAPYNCMHKPYIPMFIDRSIDIYRSTCTGLGTRMRVRATLAPGSSLYRCEACQWVQYMHKCCQDVLNFKFNTCMFYFYGDPNDAMHGCRNSRSNSILTNMRLATQHHMVPMVCAG